MNILGLVEGVRCAQFFFSYKVPASFFMKVNQPRSKEKTISLYVLKNRELRRNLGSQDWDNYSKNEFQFGDHTVQNLFPIPTAMCVFVAV